VPTIGVAVSIPEPWASQLQDYRTELGDATATMIPTHVTLVPPTEVADQTLDEVTAHLADAAARGARFEVLLRGTGTFRPVSPVVFVTVAEGIGGFEHLQQLVRSGPLEVELTYPYHPHVTVAHQLTDDLLDRAFDDLATFECRFGVEEFHLYVHDETTGWRVVRTFGLG